MAHGRQTSFAALIGRALIIPTRAIPTLLVFLYFSGWQYVNQYFDTFQINRSSFEFNQYTTFLYTFSAVSALPRVADDDIGDLVLPLLFLAMACMAPTAARRLPKGWNRWLAIRMTVWTLLLLAAYNLSQSAGSADAQRVLQTEARSVNVYFSSSLKDDLAVNLGNDESVGDERFNHLRRSGEKGALALIWRNASESIFIVFGLDGKDRCRAREIIRVSNSHIVSVLSKPKNESTASTKCR